MSHATLLLYCQHSLGMGHLVRSLALARAFAAQFDVTLLSGGVLPNDLPVPEAVEIVTLPPLGMDTEGRLHSDGGAALGPVQSERRRLVLETFERVRPAAVVVELFPFGRKKFAFELLPLLDACRARAPRPTVVCSVRDILVGSRRDQAQHDERAARTANAYFDAVLVHADPTLSRLEDTFVPETPLAVPVHYTGLVASGSPLSTPARRQPRVVVSAGGGLVGSPLFAAAVEAFRLLRADTALSMEIVTGPFLPEEDWTALARAATVPGLTLRRFVPDLAAVLADAAVSVSQCGYNTALDLLRTHVPALVVPFAEGREDEQMQRACRLEALGALRVLPAAALTPARLAREIRETATFLPASVSVDLDGAAHACATLCRLVAQTGQATVVGDAFPSLAEVRS